jgi:tetratricopeptide (TPR) repeat protein
LTLLGASATAPAHEWLLASDDHDLSRSSGPQLSDAVVDQLDAITSGLRRMDDSLGGGQTLTLVRQHLQMASSLLDERQYTDSVGRRLHTTVGELLRLAGWLAYDDGQHPLAQRYWIAALHQTQVAGDRALGANILGFMSCQAKSLGQHRQAVTLAQTALARYPGASPRVSAILELRAAEASAHEKAVSDTRRALDAAFDRLTEPAPAHGNPDWAYWVNPAQAHAQAGYCFVTLEDWGRARVHLRAALELQDDECTREGALRNALLARTYAQQAQPDLDQAVALGGRAIETLAGQVTSARCVKHVRELTHALAPFARNPGVRRLRVSAQDLLANA